MGGAGEVSAALSRAGLDDLSTHRQQVAKAKLASDPKLGMDVSLYSLASQLLSRGYVLCLLDASFREVGPDLADGGEHARTAAGAALIAAQDGLSLDSEAAQFAALKHPSATSSTIVSPSTIRTALPASSSANALKKIRIRPTKICRIVYRAFDRR